MKREISRTREREGPWKVGLVKEGRRMSKDPSDKREEEDTTLFL